MTGLKNLFQKQLPNMPKDYIARLVYDRTHVSLAIVKTPLEVIGGISIREFRRYKFAEIVFCAVSSDQQEKGYGAHLMAHLKDYVRATSPIMHFLTYADNFATGYFRKQGDSNTITSPVKTRLTLSLQVSPQKSPSRSPTGWATSKTTKAAPSCNAPCSPKSATWK